MNAVAPPIADNDKVAVVGFLDLEPTRNAQNRRVGLEDEDRERIRFDGDQRRLRKLPRGGENEASGAGAGIDDPRRCAVPRGPPEHVVDDRRRRVRRSLAASLLWRPDPAEGLAERVAARQDLVSERSRDIGLGRFRNRSPVTLRQRCRDRAEFPFGEERFGYIGRPDRGDVHNHQD